ncbi:MAG: relaxase/mobilization nuclease domain-containing protein [Synergistaceae bacterium]|nr:relaxase/mobilization nuclease domain-containing protein [Synergistaceae bacterium]
MHVHVAVNRVSPETYRAIQPAGWWTKKALERAARKIEFAQGWEIERTGRYDVDGNGNIIEKNARKAPEVSQTARDIEAHTGEQSLERIAKKETASILQTAVSWEDLHKRLAEHGFALERKGNGAVLNCSGTFVKLSKVSRECSFSKLEARLGKFVERNENIIVRPIVSLNEQLMLGENDEKTSWKRYNEERTAYLDEKSRALLNLKKEQKDEIKELRQNYRKLCAMIYENDWKGNGKNLNIIRSFLAYEYRKRYIDLKERHKEELDELKSHYLRRFPSYKQWLVDQASEDLYRTYRYPGQFVLLPEQSGVIRTPARESLDLRDYNPRRGASNSVLYCRGGASTADFSDMGRRIVLDKKKLDETSVTAALQLANQKWGATRIDGSDEYKELCVSVAVKHGLKLANPELAAEVERRRVSLHRGDGVNVTEAEIAELHLVDNPIIYTHPRTDNQQYKGRIVHVDKERGFCVQLVGKRSLFVHRLDRLEVTPRLGDEVNIAYRLGADKASVRYNEVRQRMRSL